MQSRTILNHAALVTASALSACAPIDDAYSDYQIYGESGSSTDVDDDPGDGAPEPATGDDDDASSGGEPDDPPDATTSGADAPPEILEFTIDPPLITSAGPVNITASFSPSVETAVLFEKHDGETRVLEVLDPITALAHEYAVTSDGFNGAHEVFVQGFDAEGEVVQAIGEFDVALPAGGTSMWHHVDPDDTASYAYGADVAAHGDGVVVVGTRYVQQTTRLVARRYAANNELDWEFETDDEVDGVAVAVDPDGNVYVTGAEYGAETGMWVHKLDADGVPVWDVPRSGEPDTSGLDVAVNSDGRIFVVGTRTVHDPDIEGLHEDNAMIWEYGADGAMLGSAEYDNNESHQWVDDRANAVTVLTDGRVVVAGMKTGENGNNLFVSQALVLEYASGSLEALWSAADGSWNASAAHDVVGDRSGGFAIAGWSQKDEIDPRRLDVRHFDGAASESWVYPVYPVDNRIGEARAIALDPEGRFAVGGSIAGLQSEDEHVFLSRPSGSPGWFPPFERNGSDSGNDYVYGVDTSRFGVVYYTGVEVTGGKGRLVVGSINP